MMKQGKKNHAGTCRGAPGAPPPDAVGRPVSPGMSAEGRADTQKAHEIHPAKRDKGKDADPGRHRFGEQVPFDDKGKGAEPSRLQVGQQGQHSAALTFERRPVPPKPVARAGHLKQQLEGLGVSQQRPARIRFALGPHGLSESSSSEELFPNSIPIRGQSNSHSLASREGEKAPFGQGTVPISLLGQHLARQGWVTPMPGRPARAPATRAPASGRTPAPPKHQSRESAAEVKARSKAAGSRPPVPTTAEAATLGKRVASGGLSAKTTDPAANPGRNQGQKRVSKFKEDIADTPLGAPGAEAVQKIRRWQKSIETLEQAERWLADFRKRNPGHIAAAVTRDSSPEPDDRPQKKRRTRSLLSEDSVSLCSFDWSSHSSEDEDDGGAELSAADLDEASPPRFWPRIQPCPGLSASAPAAFAHVAFVADVAVAADVPAEVEKESRVDEHKSVPRPELATAVILPAEPATPAVLSDVPDQEDLSAPQDDPEPAVAVDVPVVMDEAARRREAERLAEEEEEAKRKRAEQAELEKKKKAAKKEEGLNKFKKRQELEKAQAAKAKFSWPVKKPGRR